jgi:hypothetical protein
LRQDGNGEPSESDGATFLADGGAAVRTTSIYDEKAGCFIAN